jgi:hypothetical protein
MPMKIGIEEFLGDVESRNMAPPRSRHRLFEEFEIALLPVFSQSANNCGGAVQQWRRAMTDISSSNASLA